MQGKTREELKNITHIYIEKDKERVEKHYPYIYRERQGRNRETKAILMQGKTREELETLLIFIQGKTRDEQRNKIYIDMRKAKERVEKHYPYKYMRKDKVRTEQGQHL